MSAYVACKSKRKFLSRIRTLALLASLVVGLSTGVVAASSSPAYASAEGCTTFGSHSVDGHTFPGGYFCGNINGSGTWVNWVDGNFQLFGTICNYQVGGWFYTNSNQYWGSTVSPIHNSCTWNVEFPIYAYLYRYVPQGYVHISLLSAGVTVATVTLYIHS